MTERGLPSADASPACPFVAFEDERDERADQPDHRHRCYAEAEPAPRALAHQEAYCLSSAFPVCPVFQEWARRESARARKAAEPAMPPPIGATVAPPDRADEWVNPSRQREEDLPLETRPRRNPPRDWAAPPPWASGGVPGAAGRPPESSSRDRGPAGREPTDDTPPEARGLAGSAADRLAQGDSFDPGDTQLPTPASPRQVDAPSTGPDPDLAGLVAGPAARRAADERLAAERAAEHAADQAAFDRHTGDGRRDGADYPPSTLTGRRPAVSSTRGAERERERAPRREHVQPAEGPSWERSRRSEAYPQIKSPVSMPGIPRVAVLFGALVLAAVALFFLPALFGFGTGDDDPSASPSASVAAITPSPDPTPEPAPTPQLYVIATGDTLSRIARDFGITLEQLLEANKDRITNPDRITVGDEIIIPVPLPDEVGGTPAPSP